jgi:hypothetical protein
MTRHALVGLFAFVCLGGCERRDARLDVLRELESAERYELLSLDPTRPSSLPPDHFYGWRVLGRASITEPDLRAKLNAALRAGANEAGVSPAACFDPRHGIRAERKGKVIDLVICFACSQVKVSRDGESAEGFFVSYSPVAAFNEALRLKSVPISPN